MTNDGRQSDGIESRREVTCRVDLHAHTRFSSKGATRWLDALGFPECCSEPEEVHDLALARGMDLVAITDHNTICGAWGLIERGFDRVIVGEEISTVLCQTQCPLHILVWKLTPVLHEEIARFGLRKDAEALAGWLREHNLPHAVAHPLFDLGGKLTIETFHHCALLFGGFEIINAGHSTRRHRLAFTRFLESLSAEKVKQLERELGIKQHWAARWLTAGSDDHALLNLTRAWTAADGVCDASAFFASLMQGDSRVGGDDATTQSLAHQFVGAASAILKNRADDRFVRRMRNAAAGCRPLASALVHARKPTCDAREDHRALERLLRRAMTDSAQMLHDSIAQMNSMCEEQPEALKTVLSSLFSQCISQAPTVVSARQHLRERRLLSEIEGNGNGEVRDDSMRMCLFVDAIDHTNGVSRFVRDLSAHGAKSDKQLTVFTSGSSISDWPGDLRTFDPIGAIPTPGYNSLRLNIPQFSDLLEACAQVDPDVIHVSTPGPVGLVGVLAAAFLNVPLTGVHHTDYPKYAQRLFQSSALAPIVEKLLGDYYTRFDRVFARSHDSVNQLLKIGVSVEKISTFPAGIDLSRFDPHLRDGNVWDSMPSVKPNSVKALYVGRISSEKNLPVLSCVWRRAQKKLDAIDCHAELIVIGDGPYRSAMERELTDCRAHFLGEQTGQTLARLYASCDFFIFPSTTDTLGQAVIEAQASGLPAIVSNLGGPCEIVVDHCTGFVLPADDDDAWERAIVELATNTAKRRSMSAAAIEYSKRFSFDRTAESFWNEHEKLLDARNSRRASRVAPTPRAASPCLRAGL